MMPDKRYMDEHIVYLKKNLKKGYSKESLRYALINQGFSKVEVDNSLQQAEAELSREAAAAAKSKEKPVITQTIEPLTGEQMPKQSFFSKIKGWFG